MTNTVLAFSGGIASGKSGLSTAVAAALSCPRVSFGSYVRIVTEMRGLKQCRENWQTVGESLLLEDPRQFCRAVLGQCSWIPGAPLVVDGIRHVEVAEILRTLVAPSQFRLVHIDAGAVIRAERFFQRTPDGGSLAAYDEHSTEAQVGGALSTHADLVVDGTKALTDLADEVVHWSRRL